MSFTRVAVLNDVLLLLLLITVTNGHPLREDRSSEEDQATEELFDASEVEDGNLNRNRFATPLADPAENKNEIHAEMDSKERESRELDEMLLQLLERRNQLAVRSKAKRMKLIARETRNVAEGAKKHASRRMKTRCFFNPVTC
ncbi:unnamed protein product [Anisakis simplex]|uniref:Allatostatin n=1 Tax=Anisakis simplex TaxID=6269 RepID=A0A0M3K443_ANISI|nr:unnamed protein product [Anisakis simplex]